MFSRRRIALLTASACVLVLASAAAAAPNSFTATLSPEFVKPATTAAYTLTLANASTSDEANRAKVTIPAGFTVLEPVTATTTAAAGCSASTWEADGCSSPADECISSNHGRRQPEPLSRRRAHDFVLRDLAFDPRPVHVDSRAFGRRRNGSVHLHRGPDVNVDGDAPETTIESAPPGDHEANGRPVRFPLQRARKHV